MEPKRILAAALTAASLTVPVQGTYTPFRDIPDPEQAKAAEFLRLTGVVDGLPDGRYDPTGTLTRAQFCKLAILALDRGQEEAAQRTRTIYLDVSSSHWARGYINLASKISIGADSDGKGGVALVAGVGNGNFFPDRAITYGEATAILCRVLGYGAGDVSTGGAWYDGYLSAGAAAGLTKGLDLSGEETINRGEAALLFYNLYFTSPKGSEQTYLETLGGKEQDSGILLAVDATASDGTKDCVKTTTGIYKTPLPLSQELVGEEGKFLLDKDERVLLFTPKEGTSRRDVNIRYAEATYFMTAEKEQIDLEGDTEVFWEGKQTTWSAVWEQLPNSKSSITLTPAVFLYDASGKLLRLFFPEQTEEKKEVMIARTTPNGTGNPFAEMAEGKTYTMFKNGIPATAADLRQYDVAVYDETSCVIQVSDSKLTGIYEDASPSLSGPLTIRLMGADFELLPSARQDLKSFQTGDKVTLLFSVDGKVAGIVDAAAVASDAIGIASVDGTQVSVQLMREIGVDGKQLVVKGTLANGNGERYQDQLVKVTNSAKGRLNLQRVAGSQPKAGLDVSARMLGDRMVSQSVVVYDRVEGGMPVKVEYSSLPAAVPKEKIDFVSYDYTGQVNCMILDDATGDVYTYGYLKYVMERRPVEGEEGYYTYRTLSVRQADADGKEIETERGWTLSSFQSDTPSGIAYGVSGSVDRGDDTKKIIGTVSLESVEHVGRDAFDLENMTVTVGGVAWPISAQVQCRNKAGKTWFAPGETGVKAIRAYSDDLTLWYDRPAKDGGKIRLIEAS